MALAIGVLLVPVANPQNPSSPPSSVTKAIRSYPLTNFYDTPKPLAAGKPGELIRTEEFDEYDLPDGVVAKRILYHSRSGNDQDVATSGVVLYPDKKAPVGGWPVIAWAHDLTGVARVCAPSLARNLEHGPFLSMYVNLGYAIVATDYSGLGTEFRNAFSDPQSNAADVIFSMVAARTAVPDLGAQWIAMGYGEGGTAALGVSENEVPQAADYLGSVVISGLGGLRSAEKSPLFLAYGVKTLFPEFAPPEILTDSALRLYDRAGQSCAEPSPSTASGMLKPGWQENRFVKKYFERGDATTRPPRFPLLVIANETDPIAPITVTEQAVSKMCKSGVPIQFHRYPDADPGDIIGDSVRDQMAWIQGRFAGRPAPSDCTKLD
jgi:hypothetical protein